jgi:hypothetical protein
MCGLRLFQAKAGLRRATRLFFTRVIMHCVLDTVLKERHIFKETTLNMFLNEKQVCNELRKSGLEAGSVY